MNGTVSTKETSVISTRGRDLDLLWYKISPSGRDDSNKNDFMNQGL